MKHVYDISKRKRKAQVRRHRQAGDLGTGLEVLERDELSHAQNLSDRLAPMKQSSSDKAGPNLIFAWF